jgi:hypothetical protein
VLRLDQKRGQPMVQYQKQKEKRMPVRALLTVDRKTATVVTVIISNLEAAAFECNGWATADRL